MLKNIIIPAFAILAIGTATGLASDQLIAQGDSKFCSDGKCQSEEFSGYSDVAPFGRYSISTTKGERGTSKPLDMKRVEYLCGDLDGCEVRIAMHDWDETQRIASREGMLFYNKANRNWRTSYDMPMYSSDHDPYGTDGNSATQHLLQAWSCHLTDGEYDNWNDRGDRAKGINILSWNQYNADCIITLID